MANQVLGFGKRSSNREVKLPSRYEDFVTDVYQASSQKHDISDDGSIEIEQDITDNIVVELDETDSVVVELDADTCSVLQDSTASVSVYSLSSRESTVSFIEMHINTESQADSSVDSQSESPSAPSRTFSTNSSLSPVPFRTMPMVPTLLGETGKAGIVKERHPERERAGIKF